MHGGYEAEREIQTESPLMAGIEFASREDKRIYTKLVGLYDERVFRPTQVDNEIAAILKRAKWSLAAIMRREG